MRNLLKKISISLIALVLFSETVIAATAPNFFIPSGSGLVPAVPAFNELGTEEKPWAAAFIGELNVDTITSGEQDPVFNAWLEEFTPGAEWGAITGTLEDQTDLQDALDGLSGDIDLKEDAIEEGTTGQYWRGDKSWQTLDATAVGLGNVDDIQQLPLSYLDTDTTMAANSDSKVPSQKAAKTYMDLLSNGVIIKQASLVATTEELPASTYDNGTSGVGATLTADANGALPTIDTATLEVGNRFLVKDQPDAEENGIYTVTAVGDGGNPWVLTRATDYDEDSEIVAGTTTFIIDGGVNESYDFAQIANSPTIGTDDLIFTQKNKQISLTADGTGGIVLDILNLILDFADTNPALEIADGGVRVKVDDSSIERASGGLQIKATGVTNAMLAGSIADSKLSTISTVGKVLWAAINMSGSSINDLDDVDVSGGTSGDCLVLDESGDVTTSDSCGGGGGASDFVTREISFNSHVTTNYSYTVPIAETAIAQTQKYADLTAAAEFRLCAYVQTAAPAGSKLRLKYSTNGTTFLSLDGDNSGDLAVSTTQEHCGSWVAPVSGAKQDVVLEVFGVDGTGATPALVLRQLYAEIRENSTIVDGGDGDDVINTIVVHSHPNSAVNVTAMPATEQEFPYTNGRGRFTFDASNATDYRIEVRQGTAGFAGADIDLQYSTDNGSTWNAADSGAEGELDVGTGANTTKKGAWAALVSGAKGDYIWRLVSKEGNATINPTFYQIKVHFKQNTAAGAGGAEPAGNDGDVQINTDGDLNVVVNNGFNYSSEDNELLVKPALISTGGFDFSITQEGVYEMSCSALIDSATNYDELQAGESLIESAAIFFNSTDIGEDGPDLTFCALNSPNEVITTDVLDGTQNVGVALVAIDGDPAWKGTFYFPSDIFANQAALETYLDTLLGEGAYSVDYYQQNIFTNNGAGEDYTFANPDTKAIVSGMDDPATLTYGSVLELLQVAQNMGNYYLYSPNAFVAAALRLQHPSGSYSFPSNSSPAAGQSFTVGEDGESLEWLTTFKGSGDDLIYSNPTSGKVTIGVGSTESGRFNVGYSAPTSGDYELGKFFLKPDGSSFGNSFVTIMGQRRSITQENTACLNFDNYDADEGTPQYTMAQLCGGNPASSGNVGDFRLNINSGDNLITRLEATIEGALKYYNENEELTFDVDTDGNAGFYGENPVLTLRSSSETGGSNNMSEFRLEDGGNNWMHSVFGLVGEDGLGAKGDTIIQTRQNGSNWDIERLRIAQGGYVHIGGADEGTSYNGHFSVGNLLTEFSHNSSNYGFKYNGIYTGSTAKEFYVEIDAEGTPDTFKWSNDGGNTFEATGVSITGDWQALEDGVEIKFDTTDSNTLADTWEFDGVPELFYIDTNETVIKNALDISAQPFKPKVYSQDDEPDVPNDTSAYWVDTNDSNRYYLILDVSGTQKKVELT